MTADARSADTAHAQAIARAAARLLIEVKAVNLRPHEPFIFTSGRASPVYVDCRRLVSFPRARKRLMRMGLSEQFNDHVHHVYLQFTQLIRTQDFKEGMTSFLEKRPPDFKGR